MLIVSNRIQVNKGFESHFDQRPERSQSEEVPGRLFFALLKADEPGVYINMSVWESREAFDAWRGSEAFKRHTATGPRQGL